MNSAVVGNLKVLLSLDSSNFAKGTTESASNVKKLSDRLEKDLIPSQQKINSLIRGFVGNNEIRKALEYATAVQQVGGANKLTAQEQARTNRVVQEAIDKYRALGQQAPPHLIALANATKGARKPADELSMSLGSLVNKAKGLAGLFGVSLGGAALLGLAKGAFSAADEIGDLATKMGVSTDAAQRFKIAARQSGAEIEDVSQAIVTMNRNLADGDQSTVSALTAAGLSFDTIRQMQPEDAFRAIADAIGLIPDPMLQSKIAMDLFGKSGATLLPMIKEKSLEAADGATIMSKEMIRALKDAEQSWQDFFDGLKQMVARDLGAIVRQSANAKALITGNLQNIRPNVRQPLTVSEAAMFTMSEWFGAGNQAQEDALASLPPSPRSPLKLGAPLTLPDSREEAEEFFKKRDAALEKHSAKIRSILGDLTGADTRQRLKDLSEALRGVSVEQLSLDGIASLRAELERLARAGEKIPASLEKFRIPQLPIAPADWATLLAGAAPLNFTPPIPSLELPMPKAQAPKPLSVEDMLRGLPIPDPLMSQLLKGGIGNAAKLLPDTIVQAMTGGGNLGKSIGSMVGGEIGKSMQSGVTKSIGKFAASFIPGLGALLGPGLEKLFSVIGNIGANSTKKVRDQFAKDAGFQSLDNLYAKLKTVGAQGEQLAHIGLNVIGKKDKAANEKWMKDVTAFFDRLERVPGKVQELSSALGKFGGAIPSQLDPLLDSILGQSALSGDLRRQLEGMRKPSWQAAAEMASAFGVDTAALGSGFNQARLADSSFEIKRFIDLTGKLGGADQAGVLRGVADELSGLATEAIKNGVALPKAVQEFIRQVDEMGVLVDENGNRIDASLLQFADIEDEYQKQVVSILEQIRDLLAAPAVSAVPEAPTSWRAARNAPMSLPSGDSASFNDGSQWAADTSMLPGFAGGTHGQYVDFGPGTPVMLHGQERVMTKAEGGGQPVVMNINAIDAASFTQFIRNRGGAEVITRELPNVISRWRMAQG